MTYRIGMVGAGYWSRMQLEAWQNVANAQVIALADRDETRLTERAAEFDIPHRFTSSDAMLDALDLDVLDICTRPASHAALIKQGADAGLHILCQKPLCTTLQEAEDAARYAQSAGVRLMVNENFRWHTWNRTIHELLPEIGQVFMVKINHSGRVTLPYLNTGQTYFAEMPQLIVYELGVHYLDLCRFLFGEPESVYARLHHISPHVIGEDVQMVILGYDKMTCDITANWVSATHQPDGKHANAARIELYGTAGTLLLTPDRKLRLLRDDGQREWTFTPEAIKNGRAAAQQHFIDCLDTGDAFETSATDYLKTMRLVYAAYQSNEEKQVISL